MNYNKGKKPGSAEMGMVRTGLRDLYSDLREGEEGARWNQGEKHSHRDSSKHKGPEVGAFSRVGSQEVQVSL